MNKNDLKTDSQYCVCTLDRAVLEDLCKMMNTYGVSIVYKTIGKHGVLYAIFLNNIPCSIVVTRAEYGYLFGKCPRLAEYSENNCIVKDEVFRVFPDSWNRMRSHGDKNASNKDITVKYSSLADDIEEY